MRTDGEAAEDPEGSQATDDQERDELHQNATIPPVPPKQVQALELLAVGCSVTQVAESLEVHRSTIHRWLNTPEFIQELEVYEQEIILEIRLDHSASYRRPLRS